MTLSPNAAVTVAASANLPPFPESNVYNVCVKGTDVAGNTGADVCLLLPVYDPTAGFVTGGGEVASPVGADLLNATANGPAKFGFVSKYLPGRNTPSGNLEFQCGCCCADTDVAGSINHQSTDSRRGVEEMKTSSRPDRPIAIILYKPATIAKQ